MSDLTASCRPGTGLIPERRKPKSAPRFLRSLRLPPVLLTQKHACAHENFLEGWGSELSAVRVYQEGAREAKLQSEFHADGLKTSRSQFVLDGRDKVMHVTWNQLHSVQHFRYINNWVSGRKD